MRSIDFVPCPVCKNTDDTTIKHVEPVNAVNRLLCNVCETIYFDKEPPIAPLYDIDYNMHFFRMGDIKKAGIMANKIAEVAHIFYEKPRILEAGTGNGLTVFLLRAMGFSAVGLDLDRKLCDYLKDRFNIPVMVSRFEDHKSFDSFDIIYSSHVIEHCLDPHRFFNQAYNLLRPGGMFILDTPDTTFYDKSRRRWHHFETRNPYEHCCLLSKKGINILASESNLEIAYLRSKALYQSCLGVMVKGTLKVRHSLDSFPGNEILEGIRTRKF